MGDVRLIVMALVIAAGRIFGMTDPFYKTIAHAYTFGLLGAYFACWHRMYLWIAVALSGVEAIMFLISRYQGMG